MQRFVVIVVSFDLYFYRFAQSAGPPFQCRYLYYLHDSGEGFHPDLHAPRARAKAHDSAHLQVTNRYPVQSPQRVSVGGFPLADYFPD